LFQISGSRANGHQQGTSASPKVFWRFRHPSTAVFLLRMSQFAQLVLQKNWSTEKKPTGFKYLWTQKGLVVLTILKSISQWEGLSHILWKNVPNHQPVCQFKALFFFKMSFLDGPWD